MWGLMTEQKSNPDRASLLADVATMYYLEDKTQAEIARAVGVTRSMVSRMLKEARERGIVEVRVRRPLDWESDLEAALAERFGLRSASVVAIRGLEHFRLLEYLGRAGAQVLKQYLKPDMILALAWGTSISATVDAVEVQEPLPIKIVQSVGALGARNTEYDGHALVQRLSEKLGGVGYFLNAPFLCQSAEIARSLLEAQTIQETILLGRQAHVALLGIGSTEPKHSSFYLAGYVPIGELDYLRASGAVGDVCGIHFDIHGREAGGEFNERLVAIHKEGLLAIPVRIGVAGGPGKVEPILGALRGGYINVLVTDSLTARRVLDLASPA
jgi:DNA-binding transcriptional regulator LsrR (DeoR family)